MVAIEMDDPRPVLLMNRSDNTYERRVLGEVPERGKDLFRVRGGTSMAMEVWISFWSRPSRPACTCRCGVQNLCGNGSAFRQWSPRPAFGGQLHCLEVRDAHADCVPR